MTANPLSTIPPIGPATGMAAPPPPSRLKPVDPVRLMRQHMMLMVIAGIVGLGIGVGLYVALRKTSPQFTSQAKLEVRNSAIKDPFDLNTGNGGGGGRLDGVNAYMNNQTQLLRSDGIIRDALVRPRSKQTAWMQSFKKNGVIDYNLARQRMQDDMLKVSVIRGTTLINISMTAPSGEDASTLLDELTETYINRKKLENSRASSDLRRLFLDVATDSGDNVRDLRRQMDKFISDHQIETLGVSHSEEQISYNRYFEQHLDLSGALDGAKSSYESLQKSTSSQAMSDEENAYLKTLPPISQRQEELRRLSENRRQILSKGIGEKHESIKQLDWRRDTVEFELKNYMDKELGELRALQIQSALKQVEGIVGALESLTPKLEETSARLQELTQRLNEYEAMKIDLQIALEKKNRANTAREALQTITNRSDYTKISVLSGSSEPLLTFPTIFLVPVITMLTMAFVGGIVLVREMLDQRVRSPLDLKLLPEANLLGLVPHASEDPSGGDVAERTVERSPAGLLAESYRQIRTAVLSKMDRRGYKTLVCVSAQPEAGTSTVVQNLATSLAYNGRNVLIIDANFRRPVQHKLMETSNERGLVDVLKDDVNVEDVVVSHPDMSLSLLPTGRATNSPPELLEGATFRGLLGQLETEYDVILIDAPPALLTSDSQLLSKHVDAIAVVVQAGSDKRGMLGRVLNQLDGQRADLLGIILNGVKSAAGGYFRQSYEDFYRYREERSPAAQRPGKKIKAKRNGKAKKNGKPKKNGKGRLPDAVAESAPAANALADSDLDNILDIDLDDIDDTLT